MTLRSGLAGQIGFVSESTYATPATVTRFLPLVNESLQAEHQPNESQSVIAGARLPRSGQWAEGSFKAGGDVGIELYDKGCGLLLTHMFGSVNTTGPVSSVYTHTFTPGELSGKSMTVQVGRPNSTDGTVHPFTYSGCKVESWELACQAGEIATLGLTLAGKYEIEYRVVTDGVTTNLQPTITSATANWSTSDEGKPISGTGIPANTTILSVQSATAATMSANATATASGVTFTMGIPLATASYIANTNSMSYVSGSVTIAGSSYRAKSITISGNNNLDVDRWFLGDRGRGEPLEAGLREITGTIGSEFIDMTAYRRFLRGEEASLVCVISRPASQTTLTLTMNVRFNGGTPALDGPGIVMQDLPFKVYGTTTDALGITAVLANLESTP